MVGARKPVSRSLMRKVLKIQIPQKTRDMMLVKKYRELSVLLLLIVKDCRMQFILQLQILWIVREQK